MPMERENGLRLVIAVSGWTPETVLQSSILQAFLKSWQQGGGTYTCLPVSHVQVNLEVSSDKEVLLLTDSEELCREAAGKGICCAGLGLRGSFPEAVCVLEDEQALNAAYLRMQYAHAVKKPYIVGTTEGITLRESISGDFDALYAIFEEEGLQMFTEDEGMPAWKPGPKPGRSDIPDDAAKEGASQEGKDRQESAGGRLDTQQTALSPKEQKKRSWEALFQRQEEPAASEKPREPFRRRIHVNQKKMQARDAFEHYIVSQYLFFGYGIWTVLDENEEVVGWCGLGSRGDDMPDLGYITRADRRGQHIAYRACTLALRHASKTLELPAAALYVCRDNKVSVHLAERLGFRQERDMGDGCIRYLKLLS